MTGGPAAAPRSEVIPRVVVLDVRRESLKNFSYLVVDPRSLQSVLIDPAWEIDKIERAMADEKTALAGILVTHSHHDHIDLAKPLAAKYRCPIWMSKTEIVVSGFSATQLRGIGTSSWQVGEMLIEPIFTPGHTPGCTCYRIGENVFTGDVLFAEGCGLCPDVQAAHTMFASLQQLKSGIDPRTRVFPGHSYGQPPGRPMSQLLRENVYLQFSDQESFAAFRLRRGQDKARLFDFR